MKVVLSCFVFAVLTTLVVGQWRPYMSRRQFVQQQHGGQHSSRKGGNRIRRMGVTLSGQNVCHEKGSTFCCLGWSVSLNGKMCNKPTCEAGACGQGICRKPNLCLCTDGQLRPRCEPEEPADQRCNMRCMNGGECRSNQCRCTYGYTGPYCGQAICGLGCLNGGRCIAPGRCACVYGFTGKRCERDYRKGPCFLTRANNTCTNELSGVMCTKLYCCATVGEGWGHPCEECPARVGNCTKGRLPPHCTDINECEIMRGLCEGGTCVNTDGSFRCECPKGFRYNPVTHQCIDIDECSETVVCSGGECVNTEGGFICECPSNTKLSRDGTYCIPDVPGRCYTAIESGMCASPLSNLVRRTMCCCVQNGQETLGKCFAAVGQFPERCATIGTPEYAQDCGGHDDFTGLCSIMGDAVCSHGFCVDQPETNEYFCQCDDGYEPSADGKDCVDRNECDPNLGISICGSYGTCVNTDGSYRCHCQRGFENPPGDNNHCIDIDECQGDGLCEDGVCVNTKGSFVCNCNDGYRASAAQQQCQDIDECSETGGLCEHGRCINVKGDYRCVCNPGYFSSPDHKECIDKNECARDNMCANGMCVNMDGKFKCVCNPGFALLPNGESCSDINECLNNPCFDGRCRNTIGSFVCDCHRFKVLDESGMRCVLDSTEAQCFRDVMNGQCRNFNALPVTSTRADCCCAEPGGTSAWGVVCEPCPERQDPEFAILCAGHEIPNMCALVDRPCENGDCINMANNQYRCACNPGFLVSEDQKSCRDYDECSQNLCSNGVCTNTPGSYECTCDEGYLLNGDVCEDINECLSNPCTGGRCINEPGNYRCVCEDGSALDISGHVCHDVRVGRCWLHHEDGECMGNVGNRLLTIDECCNSIGVAWGSADCTPCSELPSKCKKGFKFDIERNECVDIHECGLGYCEPPATCRETVGSFVCVCPPGLTLSADGRRCPDLRIGTCHLGLDFSGGCEGVSVGSFMMSRVNCCCSVGRAWGDDCQHCPPPGSAALTDLCRQPSAIRMNECILFPDMCVNGLCKNTDNSFQCVCNRGFTLEDDHMNCGDIDECAISPGLCGNGVCENVPGDFLCNCDEGFEASKAMKVCIDIDECSLPGYCTGGGTCINTDGSYQCLCPDGRSLSDDRSSCVDVDECALHPDYCAPNGRCENMLGYYMCICDVGYVATDDGQDCVDIDECMTNNGGCRMGCTNTIGSYECSCDEGFVLSFDGHTCADRDECMENMNRCDGGRCENTLGSFRCYCFDGFMSEEGLTFCEDIDECAMNPNVCVNGRCHNTRGSYTCNCDDGFCVPQGQMICVDEDECEMSKHNCHVNADCTNTEGGYECTCINGFNGDGFMCHDDDECALGSDLCHEHATCVNKLGTYDCTCDEGYHGDGFSCSDDDDCMENEGLCGPYGQCINVDGSFECECQVGFVTTTDRKACKDIDECAFEQVCVNGRCHNVPGEFSCSCLDGYEKDEQGANCTDVDECIDVGNCVNGQCENSEGKYDCRCPEGFEKNPTGIGCVDNRIGDCFLNQEGDEYAPICTNAVGRAVTKATCCCSHVGGWGNPCEICPQPNTTEYDILCPGGIGFMPNPITVLLEDIDECRTLPGLCQGGRCINVFGSYICECNVGYQMNEETRTCEDVNECEEGNDVCGAAGECRNTVGGYNCACPEGFRSIMGGKKCEDIRIESCHRYFNETSEECSANVFKDTRKLCCCYEGIGQGWNTPCERCPQPESTDFFELCGSNEFLGSDHLCDINEHLCEDGMCVQLDDGFECQCPLGYNFNQDLLICEDENECEDEEICTDDAQCVNQPGTFRCACMDGFRLDEMENCVDINECEESGTCANGDCKNTRGGFECSCNNGFNEVNDAKACEDVNECDREPCGRGTCQNVFGSFTCTCEIGFRLSDNGDCVDTNECEEHSQCGKGTCQNLPGGFVCQCPEGYKVTPDGRNCLDANECSDDPLICGVGSCQNMDGSFKCFCPDGYSSPDEKSCDDVDECDLGDFCRFGDCENTPGSFRCICPDGYQLSGNKKYCIDMREGKCYAEYAEGVCANTGIVDVTKGVCCCQCSNAGWGLAANECEECPAEGTAEFNETCPNGCGYSPIGVDINECRNNPCVNGKCMNVVGSFRCICMTGFTLDESGVRCVDVNECDRDACGHGTCTNTQGSFECECDEGFYSGPTMACLDVDECREDLGLNHCGFKCENTEGSFHCACPQGFQLRSDGRMCEDVNECASDNLNDCTAKGMTCKNLIGYYTCLCPPGYRRIGTADSCIDVNECEQTRICTNGECVNQEGTFACECNEGYDYDEENKLCLDNRQGVCYAAVHQRMCEVTSTTGLLFTKPECCCNRGKGWGEECEECPHPGTEDFLVLCPHGMGFKPNGDDIDDCKVLPGLCAHGTCINTLGSYRCACQHGYERSTSGKACRDVNECLASPSPCSFDCRNTDGSYECVCPKGYQTDGSGRGCVDVDECSTKRHNCQYLCINTVGSYKCECPHGFVQEGSACVDKNECMEMAGICGPRGICRNEPGGYRCECPRGYRRDSGGKYCIDVDECGGARSSCGGGCQNVPGSFRCFCGRGYRSNLYGRGCQDVDECVHNPCGLGQGCTNTVGSFQCGCSRGLAKTSGGCGDVDECQMGGGSCNFRCQNTYGGFSCSCPRGFFRIGSGHCMRGSGGFQQRIPHYPMFPGYGGMSPCGVPNGPPCGGGGGMGGGMGMQQPRAMPLPSRDTVCYNCMPGGDVRRRQRRSADDETEGRFIEIRDHEGMARLNTSYPIEIFMSNQNLNHHTELLDLRPSLKQLRNNAHYEIVTGNEEKLFKMKHEDDISVLHFTKRAFAEKVVMESSEYSIQLKASSTLESEALHRVSLDSEVIKEAISDEVRLNVKIIVGDY
ncbi:unnamed protein product [Clavelina lepadiformis]|uniref:Fibrillin-2 n=1 Tax=Clavelina lepadiformis TaxID=159417 RepID=A0ABP0GS56_CLALP